MSNYTKGILMLLGTALCWGGSGPFVKLILAGGVSQFTVMAFRTLGASILVGAWLVVTRGRRALAVDARTFAFYALIGFLSIVCSVMGYVVSCEYLSVPQAVILHYTCPIVIMLGDCFITKERPTRLQMLAVFMILAGLYAGFGGGDGLGPVPIEGVIFGCLSIAGLSTQNLLTRSYLKRGRADPVLQLFWANVTGGAMIITGVTIFRGWGDLERITPTLAPMMLYLVMCSSVLAFGLLYSAMRYVSATLAGLICSLEVVVSLAGMPLLLGSMPSARELIGSAIILTAVAISTIRKKREGEA